MPGADLWCYFGWMGPWAGLCAVAHLTEDYPGFAAGMNYSVRLPEGGPYHNISYDGGWFLSNNDIFLYDDIYCHAMRWLRGQGLPPVRDNFTAWSEVQARECAALEGRFPEKDLTMGDMARRTNKEKDMLQASLSGLGPPPTTLDMQRHAAVKCAMGDGGCDIAYCQNWCLLPGHYIGRSKAECGEHWA